jgi:hypothetical protein
MIAIAGVLAGLGGQVIGQVDMPVGTGLVDHPVLSNTRTTGAWTRGTGAWGESMARENMRLRGYNEIHAPKLRGDQGIDLIAIRRNAQGAIEDVRIIEVKTHRGSNFAHMSETKHGKQMSRNWLAEKFKQMRASSDPAQGKLAKEIAEFRRSRGLSPEKLGEIHDINTRTGNYALRDPVSGQVRSQQRVDRLLRQLQDRGSPQTRRWATRQLAKWDQIQSTNMTGLVKAGPVKRTPIRPKPRVGRRIVRVAGPVGAAVALAVDGHELYGIWSAYASGDTSLEQLNRTLSRVGGGMAGAGAGAMTGAYVGGKVGALGGPFAWITVPAGALIGGGVGGTVGYFAGSEIGSVAADAWYRQLDDSVKDQLDLWIISMPLEAVPQDGG